MIREISALLFAAMALLCHPATAYSQSASTEAADKYAEKLRLFEVFARQQMERDKVPGITIGFYKDDYT